MWLVGGIYGYGYNVWVWLVGVVISRYIDILIIIASEASLCMSWLAQFSGIYIYIYIYIFVSMGRPFGPAWAPRNAQRANVGPAGLGSMVNVIALKTATLVLSRGYRSTLPMRQLICRRTCEWLEIGYTYRAVRISYLVHLAEVAHIHTGYCKITTCYRARPDKRAQRVAFSSYSGTSE